MYVSAEAAEVVHRSKIGLFSSLLTRAAGLDHSLFEYNLQADIQTRSTKCIRKDDAGRLLLRHRWETRKQS